MRKWACVGLFLCMTLAMLTTTGAVSIQEQEGVPLPVLMYHALLKDKAMWNDYVLSPDALDSDLAYLDAHGYTTVLPSQVIAFVESGTPLPEKPVMITLDDGCLNNLTYLPEILRRHDAVALVSVVGAYTEEADRTGEENPQYSYLSSGDILELVSDGRVEIGNHSYGMHALGERRGAMRCAAEDMDGYRHVLTEDAMKVQALLERQCGITPRVYTYPYGLISDGADEILRGAGFEMTLSCFERISRITRDADSLLSLGRFNRPAYVPTAEFMEKHGL